MSGSRAAWTAAAVALLVSTAQPAFAQATRNEETFAAQRRTRIVIHPRSLEPGPNAKRYCRAWLAVEHRPSGTVITPQRECWWQ